MEVVPEARLELARVSTKVFETSASAIPPFGHRALRLPVARHTAIHLHFSVSAQLFAVHSVINCRK